MRWLLLCLLVGTAHAEAPASPYHLSWMFPDEVVTAIEIDRGDLGASTFESPYDLVRFLARMKKPARPKPGEAAAPTRELRVLQLDDDGNIRATTKYVLQLAEWRRRLGADMVERLEDEFDAHLRMVLPRKIPPKPASPP